MGEPAPSVTLPFLDSILADSVFTLDDYRSRYVVLDLWASNCGPCKEKLPDVGKFGRLYEPKGVSVVGVVVNEPRKAASNWFAEHGGEPFPFVFDGRRYMEQHYLGVGIPRMYLIDPEGYLIDNCMGCLGFEARVAALVDSVQGHPHPARTRKQTE